MDLLHAAKILMRDRGRQLSRMSKVVGENDAIVEDFYAKLLFSTVHHRVVVL